MRLQSKMTTGRLLRSLILSFLFLLALLTILPSKRTKKDHKVKANTEIIFSTNTMDTFDIRKVNLSAYLCSQKKDFNPSKKIFDPSKKDLDPANKVFDPSKKYFDAFKKDINSSKKAFYSSNKDFDPFKEQVCSRFAQYAMFWSKQPDFRAPQSRHQRHYATQNKTIEELGYDPADQTNGYQYNAALWYTDGYIVVSVIEDYKGNSTEGGSSLRGIVTNSGLLSVCGFQDMFNGTYILRCPVYSHCVRLHIQVHHINFTQFHGVTKRLDLNVLQRAVCIPTVPLQSPPEEMWRQSRSGAWNWVSDGIDVPLLTDKEFCQHVDAMLMDHFCMIGSSHMGLQHKYIVKTCGLYIHNILERLSYIIIRFGPALTISKLVYGCRLGQRSNTRIGVMFQTGSWDLSYHGLKDSIHKMLPEIEPVLQKLSQMYTSKDTNLHKLLVLSPPTMYPAVDSYAQSRNNDMLQLFTHELQSMVESHAIPFINVFNMMYARYNVATANNHYIDCGADDDKEEGDKGKGSGQCQGEVGKAVIQRAVLALTDH